MLAPHELGAFFILLAVAGNDTTRTATSLGMHLLAENPTSGPPGRPTRGSDAQAVEEIIRVASPVTFMRRTATRPVVIAGHDFREGDRVALFYGAGQP